MSTSFFHRYILRHISVIASALLSFWLIGTACAGTELLTADERDWLTNNQSRIVLGVETGYAPFVFLDDRGRPAGLAQDYMRLIEDKIGASFKEKQFSSLKDIFEQVRAGEVHIVNAVTKTPARSQFLTFTTPFISVPNVILVRKERAGQMSEKTLSGLTVSLVKSYAITENLTSRNLGFSPDLVADDLTALLNVSFGRSDVAVTDLATASYLISTKGITNLRVAGEAELDIRLAIGTPINEPVLNRILQKGLAAITEAERKHIHDKWISSTGPSIFSDWRLWLVVGILLTTILVVIAVISIWNRTLRKQVLERTRDLEIERANLEQRVLERTSELALSEANYKELVENVNAIILRMAPDGTVTYFNEYAENFFGYKAEEILNRHVVGTIVPETESNTGRDLTEMIANLLAHPGRYADNENENITKDGRRVIVRWANRVILDKNCNPIGVLCIGTDITVQKQAEQKLMEAKALSELISQTKSEFLANMSHEIRTPMNGIIGLSQLALNQDMSTEVRDYLEKISHSSQSLLGILNDILDFSKLEAGKVTLEHSPLDLDALLDTLRDLFEERAHTKCIGFSIFVDDFTPRALMGDALRLQQILSNLLSNAIKFTEQGEVRLIISSSPAEGNRTTVHFALTDTGIGMSEETISGLFQAFNQADNSTTRKFGGTGLGLSISQRLLRLMGGDFKVLSEPEKGTTFSFDLVMELEQGKLPKIRHRRRESKAGYLEKQLQSSAKLLKGIKVLVAEDDSINQIVVSQFLKLSGMEVILANNGQEALELLQTQNVDIVLMDLHMPVMDGIEATQRIRANPKFADLPIIALTADVVEQERQHCLDIGMDEFVAKPINPEILIAILSNCVKTAQQA